MAEPRVIALAGRRVDAPDARESHFAERDIELVRQRLREAFRALQPQPAALVCAAACGADLLALEVAGEFGIRRRIVLPAAKADFRAASVVDRPGNWGPLFDRVAAECEAQGDLVCHALGDGEDAYLAGNRAILDEARALGGTAHTEAWIVWNGAPRGEGDITLHFADEAWIRNCGLREISTASQAKEPKPDLERTCFVAMPFGIKPVEGKPVYFDAIYATIIAPAIRRVELPEGGRLQPYRTDKDPTATLIDQDMFRCLEYSRIVLGDLTGENINVGIELGARFRSRASGTALFRQPGTKLPFDIAQVKVFDYDLRAPAVARDTISTVLRQSLQQNRLDSPVRRALDRGRSPFVDRLLLDAENALRSLDPATARAKYGEAVGSAPDDATIWLRLAALEKDAGQWQAAREAAYRATTLAPDYGEAWRERGVAENQIWRKASVPEDPSLPDGVQALQRATELNPRDFDALASLGGALKRRKEYPAALDAYRKSLAVSGNHPYPLLNVLKLEAVVEGRLRLAEHRTALGRAERIREQHTSDKPPYDSPWCFFDLIEVSLYRGKPAAALELLPRAFSWSDDVTKVQSFRDSLALLDQPGIQLDGLAEVLKRVEEEIASRASS